MKRPVARTPLLEGRRAGHRLCPRDAIFRRQPTIERLCWAHGDFLATEDTESTESGQPETVGAAARVRHVDFRRALFRSPSRCSLCPLWLETPQRSPRKADEGVPDLDLAVEVG